MKENWWKILLVMVIGFAAWSFRFEIVEGVRGMLYSMPVAEPEPTAVPIIINVQVEQPTPVPMATFAPIGNPNTDGQEYPAEWATQPPTPEITPFPTHQVTGEVCYAWGELAGTPIPCEWETAPPTPEVHWNE